MLAKRPGSLAGNASLPVSQGGDESGPEPLASADHPGTASAVPCIAGLSARAEQLLIGASVYREPADANAVVFHLGEHDWTAARAPDRRGPAPPYQPPRDLHELLAACTASGLLHAVARGQAGPADCWRVDPWVAGELHQQLGVSGRVAVLVTAHRRAAEYWQWRAAAWPQDRRSDLHDLLEARHHLFLAGDAEQASEVTHAVCAQLHAWGDLGREAELIHATLEMLPTRSVSRANWMHELGTIYQVRAEFGEAYRCFAGAVQMFALLGDFDGVSRGQHSLGVLAQAQGDYRRAERHYKRSSAAERRAGQRPAGGLTESVELTEGPVFKPAVPDLKPVTPLPPAGPGQRPGAPSPTTHPELAPAAARTPAPSGPATTQAPPPGAPPAESRATGNGQVRAPMPPATARAAAAPLAPVRPASANPGGSQATATLLARAPAAAATARAASNGVAAAATATVPQALATPAALPARAPLTPAPASPAAPVPAATAAAPAPSASPGRRRRRRPSSRPTHQRMRPGPRERSPRLQRRLRRTPDRRAGRSPRAG